MDNLFYLYTDPDTNELVYIAYGDLRDRIINAIHVQAHMGDMDMVDRIIMQDTGKRIIFKAVPDPDVDDYLAVGFEIGLDEYWSGFCHAVHWDKPSPGMRWLEEYRKSAA